jgi:solute carrier family 35, member C2
MNSTTNSTLPSSSEDSDDELSRISTVTIVMVSITFVTFLVYLFSRFELERGRIVILESKTKSRGAYACLLVLSWYTISSLFLLSNKWILSDASNFTSLPLTIAFVHMAVKGAVAGIVWLTCRRSNETVDSRSILSNIRVILIGTMTSLDIGFSNWSIVFVTVTTYTIFKSGILLVTFAMCVLMGLEICRARLLLASVLISVGVGLAATGDPSFNSEGLVLLVMALFSGATRWVFTQDIMKRGEVENAVQLVMVSAPWAVVAILPLALGTEYEKYSSIPSEMIGPLVTICLVGGVLSFLLVYIEVLLCHLTSSMTLTVLGILKTVLQIFLGFVVFGDDLGTRNISGLVLVLIGVMWYKSIRQNLSSLPQNAETLEIEVELGNRNTRNNKNSNISSIVTENEEESEKKSVVSSFMSYLFPKRTVVRYVLVDNQSDF